MVTLRYLFALVVFVIPLSILTVYQAVINNEILDPSAINFRPLLPELLPKLKGKTLVLIPHSHCDPGWTKTFQEYNDDVVSKIIDGVMNELIQDRNKKFIWSEISFLKLWWDLQTPEMHDRIRQLIQDKQLEIVGGGWVMNDEACVEVGDVIEQTTEGHLWVKYNLNTTIRHGWQIDPFGHSSLTPSVFPGFGLETLVINRVSQTYKDYMKEKKELQFMWEGSRTLGESSHLFTHTLSRHYGYMGDYPYKLPFDQFVLQIEKAASAYLWYVSNSTEFYQSNVLMLPLGDDFQYQNAQTDFRKADFFVKSLRKYGIDARYGTLQDYYDLFIQDSKKNNYTYPLFKKDFFPYISQGAEPWTGFYTTHTIFKSQVRETSKLVRATDQLYGLAIAKANAYNDRSNIEALYSLYSDIEYSRRMVGLAQHHDSITGTARSYVMHDYLEKLLETKKKSGKVYSVVMEYLLQDKPEVKVNSGSSFAFKNLLDLDALTKSDQSFAVVFQNSLAWSRKEHTSVRVSLKDSKKLENIELIDASTMKSVNIQILPVVLQKECMGTPVLSNVHHYNLHFVVQVPPMGMTTYYVRVADTKQPLTQQSRIKIFDDSDSLMKDTDATTLSSKYITASFGKDGMVQSITKNVGGVPVVSNVTIQGSIRQYTTKRGGAYLFCPIDLVEFINQSRLRFISLKGDLVEQLSLYSIGDNICSPTTVIMHRLYNRKHEDSNAKDEPLSTEQSLELGYSVVGDPNRDTVLSFQTGIYSNGKFYTDNGLESRIRDSYNTFPTIGYYYYPTIHMTYLKNDKHQFTIYTQRTYGVSSPTDGELEIMIHRNLLQDDEKGLGYPNADFTRSDGKIYLSVDNTDYVKANQNQLSTLYNTPFIISNKIITSIDKYKQFYKLQYSLFKNELPRNLHVHSLKFHKLSGDDTKLDKNNRDIGNQLFIRIGHLMTDDISKTEYLQSQGLFNTDYQLSEFKEKMLNLLDKQEFNERLRLPVTRDLPLPECTGDSEYGTRSNIITQHDEEKPSMDIKINPLEIKSYSFKLNYKSHSPDTKLTDTITVSSGLEIKLENDQVELYYPQDFSLVPLDTFYNKDTGNHVEYEIAIYISFAVAFIFIFANIGMAKRNRRIRKENNQYYQSNQQQKQQPKTINGFEPEQMDTYSSYSNKKLD